MVLPKDYFTAYETDYKKGKLSFGVKFAFVNTYNDFKRYNVLENVNVYDSARSNSFDYKENVNAAYINYNKQYKSFMVQAGLRVEQTNIQGDSYGYSWNDQADDFVDYKGSFD